jgi:hypothetical protein
MTASWISAGMVMRLLRPCPPEVEGVFVGHERAYAVFLA